MFIQNFYTLTTVFMDSKYSFRPNLLDIEKILILPIPWHLFGPRQLYTKNQHKWLKMAFLAHLIVNHIKTFLLKLIKQWLVGRFEGLTRGYQPAWNEFVIANGYWAIALNSKLYPQLDFGLYWGCLEAEITKLHLGKFSRPKWIRSCPKILAQPQGSLSSKILLGTTLLDPHPVVFNSHVCSDQCSTKYFAG